MREQRTLASAVGLVDRSNRGVVAVPGPDRLTWLHSLTTQDIERLPPEEATQALVLSPHGHVEHHLTLVDHDGVLWLHVEPGAAPGLLEFLASMRFMLRVDVADVTDSFAVLSLLGPSTPADPPCDGAAAIRGAFGTDLIVTRDQLAGAAADLAGAGLVPAGMAAYEALRIAAHQPRLGLDTDHRTIPHEVGWIETAVHLSKGCYRGQETVARVHNLGHPPRRLVFLHLDGSEDRLPAHGDEVSADGAPVGFVGSAARHFEQGPIALGLVKRTVDVAAPLRAGGVPAAQEVVVSPDAGAHVQVALKRPRGAAAP
jgi:folate-binding protein YgfZ